MPLAPTEPITDLKQLKGIDFPSAIRFRQLLVTGPPGCGKSTLIQKIGGWSEEGYIDLTINKWWTAQSLAIRPREIHLGLPFVGHDATLAVYDEEWIKAGGTLQLDVARILVPPRKRHFLSVDWAKRYAFEFLLPPAQSIYEWRSERARRRTHHVDENLSLELVSRQVDTFCQVAEHMHRQGMTVYVRKGLDGPLGRFTDTGES